MNCNLQTDLAHHNPFTIALKNFSHKTPEKEKGYVFFSFFILNMEIVLVGLVQYMLLI